jgi:uracil-DNA glycosylase
MTKLDNFVAKIRQEMNLSDEVPGFDPQNGNERARILFILEAPGAKAVKTGYISFDNPDPTANNFRDQLAKAGIDRSEIAIWNIVPWYIGSSNKIRPALMSDINKAKEYLGELIDLLDNLEYVVLMGDKARKAHVYLSHRTKVRILGCHHTSQRVVNNHVFPQNVAGSNDSNRLCQLYV